MPLSAALEKTRALPTVSTALACMVEPLWTCCEVKTGLA